MIPFAERKNLKDWKNVAYGLAPDGSLLYDAFALPHMPVPWRVVVGDSFLEINGWIVALSDINKGTLTWIGACLKHWKAEDPSEENIEWLNGIKDTLLEALHPT